MSVVRYVLGKPYAVAAVLLLVSLHAGLHQQLREAIIHGAGEVGTPTLLSTLCICIVFVPLFLLVCNGVFQCLRRDTVWCDLHTQALRRTASCPMMV